MTGVWKYAAIVLFSLVVGLITGEYLPNRNIATKDDLKELKQNQVDANEKIDALRRQQEVLIVVLKTKGVIPDGVPSGGAE